MRRLRLLVSLETQTRAGRKIDPPGAEVDLPQRAADQLLGLGLAELPEGKRVDEVPPAAAPSGDSELRRALVDMRGEDGSWPGARRLREQLGRRVPASEREAAIRELEAADPTGAP